MSRPARTRRSVCPLGFPSPSLVKSPYFSYHLLRCLHAAYWKQDWQQYSGTIFNTLKRHHLGSVPIQSAVTKNRGGGGPLGRTAPSILGRKLAEPRPSLCRLFSFRMARLWNPRTATLPSLWSSCCAPRLTPWFAHGLPLQALLPRTGQ